MNISQYNDVIRKMENLKHYHDAKVQAGSLKTMPQTQAVHFGSKLMARAAVSDSDDISTATHPLGGFGLRWILPLSVHEDDDDHPSSVLGKDNYL